MQDELAKREDRKRKLSDFQRSEALKRISFLETGDLEFLSNFSIAALASRASTVLTQLGLAAAR